MTDSSSGGSSWLDQLLGIPGTISSGIGSFTSLFSSLETLGAALLDVRTYIRIFMVVFGLFLIWGALKYVG